MNLHWETSCPVAQLWTIPLFTCLKNSWRVWSKCLARFSSGSREAPTPSPKIISVSGAKNEPLLYLLVLIMTTFPFLLCWCKRSRVSKACNRGASRLGEAWARPPRTQNVLSQGQSEAYGDSKLYNTIVEVPARLNLSWCLCCLARILSRSWGRPQGKPRGFLVMEIAANQTI